MHKQNKMKLFGFPNVIWRLYIWNHTLIHFTLVRANFSSMKWDFYDGDILLINAILVCDLINILEFHKAVLFSRILRYQTRQKYVEHTSIYRMECCR